MKKTVLIASLAALAFIGGCNDNKDTTSSNGNMGVVGESKKDSCCSQKSDGGSMGVMQSKDGHCEGKTGCDKAGTCPMDKKQN